MHHISTSILAADIKVEPKSSTEYIDNRKCYNRNIVWKNVFLLGILHVIAVIALLDIIKNFKFKSLIYVHIYAVVTGFGITAGSHRLWSHRAYKAKLPLQVLLLFLQTSSFQNSVFTWVRDHRLHHKYTDTDADPHNSKRGLFFSHMGWLLVRKHEEVRNKKSVIFMDDIISDKLLMFQHRHYNILMIICAFFIPSIFYSYIFKESLLHGYCIGGVLRYIYSLHHTWTVNSLAHFYGTKPYDKSITASDSKLVGYLAIGEGWHNYHHIFPWDYKAAELGTIEYNFTLAFINIFAKLGLAYDLKTVSFEAIKNKAIRSGDGSWTNRYLWGWNDKNMTKKEYNVTKFLNKK